MPCRFEKRRWRREPRVGTRRTDPCRDRRQLRHRARDGPARARRRSRRHHHGAQRGPPAPSRSRARGQHRGLRRHQLRPARRGSSTSCPRRSTTCWSPARVPATRRSAEFDFEEARRDVEAQLLLPLQVARNAASKVRPGGTLALHWAARVVTVRPSAFRSSRDSPPRFRALTKNLALEIAPVRVNLIAAGFVDTPLSAAILGDQLDARREQLRTTLPIRRVVGPADIAALAVHLMTQHGGHRRDLRDRRRPATRPCLTHGANERSRVLRARPWRRRSR